jgi:hypothetical protein
VPVGNWVALGKFTCCPTLVRFTDKTIGVVAAIVIDVALVTTIAPLLFKGGVMLTNEGCIPCGNISKHPQM